MKTIGLLTIPVHKDYNSSSICIIVVGSKEELQQLMLSQLFIEHLLNTFCVLGP